jgi:hypothetical protein
MSVLVVDTFA